MQQLAVSAKPVVVHVGLHWTSLVVSCLFTLNLVAMPFYFYLHMPIFPVEEEAVPGVNSTRAYVTSMQARYTPRLANQVYVSDVHSGIIALRTDLSSELLGLCDDHKALLGSRIQGSVFFSPSIQAMTIEFVCGKNHTNVDALWGHYYFGVHVTNSVLWSSQHGDVSTLCYLFDPFVHYWTCSILEFLSRVFLSGYIAHQCWRYFYDPVAQLFGDLRSNPQGKTCRNVQLVIGEPTSLVVSNAWIVLAFTMDILLHPGTLGSATLRLIQPFDVWGGVLGSLYFGRLVWVSYAALWLWNYLYKHSARLSPVSCTVCAWTTTVLGVVLTKIDFIWTLALQLFMAMFNVHQAVEAIDVTFGTIVSCVLYGLNTTDSPWKSGGTSSTASSSISELVLISELCSSVGQTSFPPRDALNTFLRHIHTLDHTYVCELLEFKLEDSLWQVVARALAVLDALFTTAAATAYLDYFSARKGLIDHLTRHAKQTVKSRAEKHLPTSTSDRIHDAFADLTCDTVVHDDDTFAYNDADGSLQSDSRSATSDDEYPPQPPPPISAREEFDTLKKAGLAREVILEVELPAGPMGIILDRTSPDAAILAQYAPLPTGGKGFVELHPAIVPGCLLVALNGNSIEHLALPELGPVLAAATTYRRVLTFKKFMVGSRVMHPTKLGTVYVPPQDIIHHTSPSKTEASSPSSSASSGPPAAASLSGHNPPPQGTTGRVVPTTANQYATTSAFSFMQTSPVTPPPQYEPVDDPVTTSAFGFMKAAPRAHPHGQIPPSSSGSAFSFM
ncbi:hypothetical protein B5M09_006640 [Aphanomyces astaci]|uniref:PDZ domain-containing protein n=1 Tax=Aphanomyces astaci TaxID=112090 RepID=A0A425DAP0_APHAT|nr:hypothetical protein B5M09_006640 [Aphanomyces astaci]